MMRLRHLATVPATAMLLLMGASGVAPAQQQPATSATAGGLETMPRWDDD